MASCWCSNLGQPKERTGRDQEGRLPPPQCLLPVPPPPTHPRGLLPGCPSPRPPRAHHCQAPPTPPNTESHLCHIPLSQGLKIKVVFPTTNQGSFQERICILQEPSGNNSSTHLSKTLRAFIESGSLGTRKP